MEQRRSVWTRLRGEVPVYDARSDRPEDCIALQKLLRSEVFPDGQVEAVGLDFSDEGPDGWGGPWIFTVLHGEGGRRFIKKPLYPWCRRMYEGHECLVCTPFRDRDRRITTRNRPLQIIHKGNERHENLDLTRQELMDSMNTIKVSLENAREECRIRNILAEDLLDLDVSYLERAVLPDVDVNDPDWNPLTLVENPANTAHASLLHGGVQQRLHSRPGNTNVFRHEAFLNMGHDQPANRRQVFEEMAAAAAASSQADNGLSNNGRRSNISAPMNPGRVWARAPLIRRPADAEPDVTRDSSLIRSHRDSEELFQWSFQHDEEESFHQDDEEQPNNKRLQLDESYGSPFPDPDAHLEREE